MRSKKIVFLYTSLNGFVISTLKALRDTRRCESIDVLHWKPGATSGNSYVPEEVPGVGVKCRDGMNLDDILEFLVDRSPDIIYLSGWVDRGYLDAVRRYRAMSSIRVTTVCGIDDQWRGSMRQVLGRFYFRFRLRSVFDRMWVAGAPQYHYARQFGYDDASILYNLLSADRQRFSRAHTARRFVYVGRFEPVKGLELLLRAYGRLSREVRSSWPLVMIGGGSQCEVLRRHAVEGVEFTPYLQPGDLVKELEKGGVGCHPAIREPWGVSIHELVTMGYPMLVAQGCGAASEFVIHGFNGFVFECGNEDSLVDAMRQVTQLDDADLSKFGDASVTLALRISPETVARNFLTADAAWRGGP